MKRFLPFLLTTFVSASLLGIGRYYIVPKYGYTIQPIDPNSLIGRYDPGATAGVFYNQNFPVPSLAASGPPQPNVLGYPDYSNRRIEIDLANQRVYAYEGDDRVYDFLVSTGKWGRTPTGNFRIWVKLRYTLMAGGSQALGTYYYLPNVPFVMYYSGTADDGSYISPGQGYSLHGTYWHSNFGHPMSHGCINMYTPDAEKMFYWAAPDLQGQDWGIYASADNSGTPIRVYGVAPYE